MSQHVYAELSGSRATGAAQAGPFSSAGSPTSLAGAEGDADRQPILRVNTPTNPQSLSTAPGKLESVNLLDAVRAKWTIDADGRWVQRHVHVTKTERGYRETPAMEAAE